MGCDIHLYSEKQVDGVWVVARPELFILEYPEESAVPDIPYSQSIYHARNYSLFAILANVRNGRGFAGCDIGDGFVPIAEHKGLPSDVSSEIRAISDRWDCDGHSHSHFTLQELLDYDWTQVTKERGWVSAPEYYQWTLYNRGHGEGPDAYCGGISGNEVKHFSTAEMDKAIDTIKKQSPPIDVRKTIREELPSTYCQAEWDMPYYKTVRRFWSDAIPQLLRLGKPEDVRIVFWFDN